MSTDMEFARDFALWAGEDMKVMRATTRRSKKLDGTDVSDEDEKINRRFIGAVKRREGGRASVRGEEKSAVVRNARRVWVIDPIDGTGDFLDDSMPFRRHTACVAICLMVDGVPRLSVVHNPFRNETFTAEIDGPARLNGRRITCSSDTFRKGMRYDFSHWRGAAFDLRGLESLLGKPIGVYSAIYQACMVAAGRSGFAVFPGNTLHDIAPGALIVARAAGRVTDLRGRRLDWSDLSHGVIYASRTVHVPALRAIRGLRAA